MQVDEPTETNNEEEPIKLKEKEIPTAVDTIEPTQEMSVPKAKRYSPTKCCPFPSCDGTGSTKAGSSTHFSIKSCPMAREEKKRERELLVGH